MPKFRDYEYGFYGFIGSMNSRFMETGFCHIHKTTRTSNKHKNPTRNLIGTIELHENYTSNYNNIMNQLPKVQDVKFISGDYKDAI